MTLIDKIKKSVEGATGLPFLYHAAGEINELIARCQSLPVAYSFLIDSGTIDDVNGRYHERVTLAVMFCDKTEFDFNALENEEIIDRMKEKAYKWMSSLRMSNTLNVVSVNNTQRLYDTTTDILTGFAVNITIEDVAGVGECELPQVVIDVDKNGSYDVVGVDKVRVNVVPKLEDLEVTQNGEYLPPTDIAGFSKVSVDVQPVLEELTITQNGEYLPKEGVAGFSKVTAEFDPSGLPKVKVSQFKVTNECLNEDGIWEGEKNIDTSLITTMSTYFDDLSIKEIDVSGWNTSKVTNFLSTFRCPYLKTVKGKLDISGAHIVESTFQNCSSLTTIDTSHWSFNEKLTSINSIFSSCTILQYIDVSNWNTGNISIFKSTFYNIGQKLTGDNYVTLDISKWDMKNAVNLNSMFGAFHKIKELDLRKWKVPNVTNTTGMFGYTTPQSTRKLVTLVGGETIENVLANGTTAMKDLKVGLVIAAFPEIDRASLRALINGLADLTGKTPQTLTIGATLLAKLTEEDIAIATNKNWTIV